MSEPRIVPARWDFEASFAFGISLILDGVEATVSRIAAKNR
jgi:hypothetical protein